MPKGKTSSGAGKGGGAGKPARASRRSTARPPEARGYKHDAKGLLRPDVGVQASFRKRKPPQTYRYDSSLSPALDWDAGNPARELGEWLLGCIEEAAALAAPHEFPRPRAMAWGDGRVEVRGLRDAVEALRRMSRPFLEWSGKAERLSFDVPTLPLFVHERLSTRAILETLKGHRRDRQLSLMELFGDPQRSVSDQLLRAYEHQGDWVNRLVLGDSLVVMNSLLRYEGLGGQVQMVYLDPPYGVKFGSNFQPFVRKRDVKHNDDGDFTREPEMVQAYRDTWELGLHSYLTYLRDRLLLARDLLAPSGSIFVQISDENVHHVRELLDEVFGAENFVSLIPFRKKTMPLGAKHLESVTDYLLWYARDIEHVYYQALLEPMTVQGDPHWNYVELADGTRRRMSREEVADHGLLPFGSVPCQLVSLYPAGVNESGKFPFRFRGKTYVPPAGNSWFTHPEGMQRLADAGRLEPYEDGQTLRYVLKFTDSPVTSITNLWHDTSAPRDKVYAVQTSTRVIERCLLMTSKPGDLVLDPTCGSGTTAYVAEQWGRRWIAIDTSRVPLALARQRLLTATFKFHELKDERRGPAGGFVYKARANGGVGGVVPYVSKGSIANNEDAAEEVLVDRPESVSGITRVTGAFCVEATIPTPVDWDDAAAASGSDEHGSFVERLLEVLRRSPTLHLGSKRTVTLTNLRRPAKSLSLSAEAQVDAGDLAEPGRASGEGSLRRPVALVFGPENGAVSERLVHEAAREAYGKSYAHLFVIGFAIQANARALVENCEIAGFAPATYVQATPDLLMGDLLKTLRSSQIFSVCGSPEVRLRRLPPAKKDAPARYSVELLGLDVFDPATMTNDHRRGDDVPAWLLDADYNGLCFHVTQAFFPRTAAWDDLRRSLKGEFEDSVWEHLAGTRSTPFEAGDHGQVAVKVIDDRGNELLVVKPLAEAEE